MQRRHAGFTLIELVMTMTIAATIAAVSLPAMAQFIEHQRTSSAMEALTAHMQLARMTAVSRNSRAVLCPTRDGNHCDAGIDWSLGWMLFTDEDGNHQPDSGNDILRADVQPASTHLRITSNTGRQQLRYLPDGTSAGSNLTLSICSARGELLGQVIVNNAGRPRSDRPKAPTPCPV